MCTSQIALRSRHDTMAPESESDAGNVRNADTIRENAARLRSAILEQASPRALVRTLCRNAQPSASAIVFSTIDRRLSDFAALRRTIPRAHTYPHCSWWPPPWGTSTTSPKRASELCSWRKLTSMPANSKRGQTTSKR